MELQFKHIAPYLPYGLKFQIHPFDTLIDYTDKINGIGLVDSCISLDITGDYYLDEDNDFNAKPILRPLSDLHKEIEHNGEKIIPIETICDKMGIKGKTDGKYLIATILADGFSFKKYYFIEKISYNNTLMLKGSHKPDTYPKKNDLFPRVDYIPYHIYELLFQWHFDVFGLIQEGLAVDINTVEL